MKAWSLTPARGTASSSSGAPPPSPSKADGTPKASPGGEDAAAATIAAMAAAAAARAADAGGEGEDGVPPDEERGGGGEQPGEHTDTDAESSPARPPKKRGPPPRGPFPKRVDGLPHPLSVDPFRSLSSDPGSAVDPDAFLSAARAFLIDSAPRPCRKVHRNSAACSCLRDVASPPRRLDLAADFMLSYARKGKGERQVAVKEWMRQAEIVKAERGAGRKRDPCYPLPGVWREPGEVVERDAAEEAGDGDGGSANEEVDSAAADDDEGAKSVANKQAKKKAKTPPKSRKRKRTSGGDSASPTPSKRAGKTPYYVCQHALARLTNLGLHQWKSLLKTKSDPSPLVHGLAGRRPNSSTTERAVEARAAMRAWLMETHERMELEGDGEEFAGKSMRALYEQFCYGRGYVLHRDKDGSYGRMEDYELREFNSTDWPPGSVPLPVLSKDVFDAVYNELFPDARERRKRDAARAEEDRKKRLKEVEKLLRAERKERERDRARHEGVMGELERRLEREREERARERGALMGEIAVLKGRLAEMERLQYLHLVGARRLPG